MPMSEWPSRSCMTLSVADDDTANRLRGVAHALRRDAGNASLFDERVHQTAEVVRVHPAAEGGGEDKAGVSPGRADKLGLGLLECAVPLEHGRGDVAEGDDPV